MSHQEEYVSIAELNEIQKKDTREIIQALLDDGSDPDALYEIEHHLFTENFELLEKAAVDAFKLGFEVFEADEVEDDEEEGSVKLFCFDATISCALDPEVIDQQAAKLIDLSEKYDIIYDGWGTYYEGEDALMETDEEKESE